MARADDEIDGMRYAIDAVPASVHASFSSRLAISIAASAASSPLLPWLPPARA
jgi:hypothetical protein